LEIGAGRQQALGDRSLGPAELLGVLLGPSDDGPGLLLARSPPGGDGFGRLVLGVAVDDLGLRLGVGQDLPGLLELGLGLASDVLGLELSSRPDRRGQAIGLGAHGTGAGSGRAEQSRYLLTDPREFVVIAASRRLIP
jgi:hypothetical protein